MSIVSFVDVEGVVTHIGNSEILGVYRTTEELNSVVLVGEDFNVVHGGTITYATEGKTVDLIPRANLSTTVTDGDILKNT